MFVQEGIYQSSDEFYAVICTIKRADKAIYDVIFMDTAGEIWSCPLQKWNEYAPRFTRLPHQEQAEIHFLEQVAANKQK